MSVTEVEDVVGREVEAQDHSPAFADPHALPDDLHVHRGIAELRRPDDHLHELAGLVAAWAAVG